VTQFVCRFVTELNSVIGCGVRANVPYCLGLNWPVWAVYWQLYIGARDTVHYYYYYYYVKSIVSGPGSSVGIPTDFGLEGPGFESRWGRDFPHLSRQGPPSLLYNGYRVFHRGRKWPGRDADPSPPSTAEV
jgi:hypothetical protein